MDLTKTVSIGDPAISPDGKSIAVLVGRNKLRRTSTTPNSM